MKFNLSAIVTHFDTLPTKVFSYTDLTSIYESRQSDWNLPSGLGPAGFVELLIDRTKMRDIRLKSNEFVPLRRFSWGPDASPLTVSLSVRRSAYFSHASAMWIHGIGDRPNPVYVNCEQSVKTRPQRVSLTQEAIDRAFRNHQRETRMIYFYRGTKIAVLNGKNSGRLEVIAARAPSGEPVEVTSVERTLVDIVVRPAYAGGVLSVLEAFRLARARVSAQNLIHILNSLSHAYPFHQAIGFCMKRSGFSDAECRLVKELGTPYDFYLGYGIKNPAFDTEFRLFYPKSLD